MQKNKVIIFFFLIFLLSFGNVFAQTKNVGIIPSNIWYSKEDIEEGDKIKIFTVIYNPDSRELSGTVIFFDNNVMLGKDNFTVSAKSIKDVSIDWTATAGDHLIFAKIENAKFLISKDKYEEVYLAENKTEESKLKISSKITENKNESTEDSSVQKMISENTPPFVTQTINTTVSTLEEWREESLNYFTERKEEVQEKINTIEKKENTLPKETLEKAIEKNSNEILFNNAKEKNNKKEITTKIEKPFRYLQLFFLNLFAFIFKTKVLFYIILFLLLFLILRFIWRLIF